MKRTIFGVTVALITLLFATQANAQTTLTHVVKRGDTFSSIASKYGITEKELRKSNPNVKKCIAGSKLQVKANRTKQQTAKKTTKQQTTKKTAKQQAAKQKSKRPTTSRETKVNKRNHLNEKFQKGLTYYNNKKWGKAIKEFKEIMDDEQCSPKMKKSCQQHISNAKQFRSERRGEIWGNIASAIPKVVDIIKGAVLQESSNGGNATSYHGYGTTSYSRSNINDDQIDPILLQRRETIQKRLSHVSEKIQRNLRQQNMIINSSSKSKNDRLAKLKKEYADLQKEFENIKADGRALNQEIETSQRQAAEQRAAEQERINAKYEKAKAKADSETKSAFKSGRGDKLMHNYWDQKSIVHKIKIHSASYDNFSVNEKRKLIRDAQKKMKSLRAEYKEGAGSDLPGASNSLENWNPTDTELISD